MAIEHVLHKRSSTKGHTPVATGLSYGELAINYSGGGEALFIRNSNDETVDFQPTKNLVLKTEYESFKEDHELRLQQCENACELYNAHKVLWVGTSIPAGSGTNNYPQMVADALGFKLYNNSIGASFCTLYPNNGIVNDESYYWTSKSDIKEHIGYCLSATKEEIENKFRPVLENIQANDSTLTDEEVENYIATWKWCTYESRIIPYINGTIDTCDVVVIDHGYNDRDNICNVAANYADETLDYESTTATGGTGDKYPDPARHKGCHFIKNLGNRNFYQGELYMNSCYNNGMNNNSGMKHEYMGALTYIICQILKTNPRIKIIIGNYFAQRHPYQDDKSYYICEANRGVAEWFGLQHVDVYKYTGILNKSFTDNSGNTASDFARFCPDGVHPHSDTTGESNKRIAEVYINQLKGIV